MWGLSKFFISATFVQPHLNISRANFMENASKIAVRRNISEIIFQINCFKSHFLNSDLAEILILCSDDGVVR